MANDDPLDALNNLPDMSDSGTTAGEMATAILVPIITTLAVQGAIAALMYVLGHLLVTNYKKRDITGDTAMHPTTDEVNMNKVDAGMKTTDGALASDKLSAKDGDLTGMRTDAGASDSEATAMEGGASAIRTKAGAMDTETKGLKIT